MKIVRAGLAATLFAAVLLAGCGDDDDSGDADASPTTGPAATSTAAPEGEATAAPVAAGEVSSSQFAPEVAATVGEGWSLVLDEPFGFEIEHRMNSRDTGWISVFRPAEYLEPDNYSVRIPPPDDVAAWFAAHNDFQTRTGPVPVTFAGKQAQQVDLAGDNGYSPTLFPVGPDGDYHVDPRSRIRVIVIDQETGPPLIAVINSEPAAQFDEFLAIAQPVLDSMTIE